MISGIELLSLTTLRLFLLVLGRCVGTVWFAPVLGGAEISRLQKSTCAFLLAALVLPVAISAEDASTATELTLTTGGVLRFALEIVLEFLLGAAIGLFLKIFFQGVVLAGETIARIGGVSVAESFNPSLGGEASATSSFLFWISLAVFIVSGGVEAFVDGFLNFFMTVAPGSLISSSELISLLSGTLSSAFALGLRLSAPVILATAVVYIAVGVNGRLFSQLNLSTISFNVNAMITLTLLFLCVGVICHVFQDEIVNYIEKLFSLGSF